jgi:hypothetical protein
MKEKSFDIYGSQLIFRDILNKLEIILEFIGEERLIEVLKKNLSEAGNFRGKIIIDFEHHPEKFGILLKAAIKRALNELDPIFLKDIIISQKAGVYHTAPRGSEEYKIDVFFTYHYL